MSQVEFEGAFHSRTLAYHRGFRDSDCPVVIRIGDNAHTPAGHALVVALVNQLARAHRSLVLVGNLKRPLLIRDVFGQDTLEGATLGLARAINPFIQAERCETIPADALVSLGIGSTDAEISLGAEGWCALIERDAKLDDRPHAIWGALYASCVGAEIAFHRLRDATAKVTGRFSLWKPGTTEVGPEFGGPIDVGRVLQVGSGGVGAALDYFLALLGVAGAWLIVDGDAVDATNLNRQLLFVADDAGFRGDVPARKAIRAASLLGANAEASDKFYDEDPGARTGTFDVVLALANDRSVRSALQARQPTVLLHATTGLAWEAFLHRHIAGRDDCIVCRLGDTKVKFKCAEGAVEVEGEIFDASLPFLSATAGLALAAALARLHLGALHEGRSNLWSFNFAEPAPLVRAMEQQCRNGCRMRLAPSVRQRIDAASRYVELDRGTELHR